MKPFLFFPIMQVQVAGLLTKINLIHCYILDICRSVGTWVTCRRHPDSVLLDYERSSRPMEQVPGPASGRGATSDRGRNARDVIVARHGGTRGEARQENTEFLLISQFWLTNERGVPLYL